MDSFSREHNPGADHYGPSTQASIVSLLDRRKERVDVGMQNRRLLLHEHMFAQRSPARWTPIALDL
jgi:hypothetical protein